MALHRDAVFAPIDLDESMERLAGGNETEVYRSDDGRYVVKLKADLGGSVVAATFVAQQMRAAAEAFAECLGTNYTIPSEYVVARDTECHAQVLVIQPFLCQAKPLHNVDYAALSAEERANIAIQLRDIIRRSLAFYRITGSMPDLYGRTSVSAEERKRNGHPLMMPQRVWSFLAQRNLLRSHNLMLAEDRRVVLVDYDVVRRSKMYRAVYYAVRWMLFWRDHVLIVLMREGGAATRSPVAYPSAILTATFARITEELRNAVQAVYRKPTAL